MDRTEETAVDEALINRFTTMNLRDGSQSLLRAGHRGASLSVRQGRPETRLS